MGEPRKSWTGWGLYGVCCAAVALLAGLIWYGRSAPAATASPDRVPVLGAVCDFHLTERSGTQVQLQSLAGRPWIAGFIFTRCGGICPALTARMAWLQKQLSPDQNRAIRLVSISVDPEYDSPAVLREYAKRFGADPQSWLFLTGPRPEVYRLVHDCFKLMMVELPAEQQAGSDEPIAHSDRLVLVDGTARIRGYYRGSQQVVLEQLKRDLAALQ